MGNREKRQLSSISLLGGTRQKSPQYDLGEQEIAVLEFVINYNLSTGKPVGSRVVYKSIRKTLELSSTSIRNTMAYLEYRGYLEKTHPFSGRIPTKKCMEKYGRLVGSDIYKINVEIIPIIEKLIVYLSSCPRIVYHLSPNKFEEIVAEIFHEFGFDIKITNRTRDGGRDIIAHKKTSISESLYLIECKRYSEDRKVGVDLVRKLYGVSQLERATLGILVTTSFFTKCAHDFREKVKYQISLKDFIAFQKWVNLYVERRIHSKK